MYQIKDEKKIHELIVTHREQLLHLMLMQQITGIENPNLLMKSYLNEILPLPSRDNKKYDSTRTLRCQRKRVLNKLIDTHLKRV